MRALLIIIALIAITICRGVEVKRTLASLSQARWNMGATAAGNYALFGGGRLNDDFFGDRSLTKVVDIFDSISKTWTTANLSKVIEGPAATSVGKYAFFAGVLGPDSRQILDIFDSSTGQWTVSQLETFFCDLAVSVGKYALFASQRRVVVFDSTTLQIVMTTNFSLPRARMAAASAGKYALFAGGRTLGEQDRQSDRVEILNTETLEWSTSVLERPVEGMVGVSAGGYALFAGGAYETYTSQFTSVINGSNLVRIFDPSNFRWTTVTMNQGVENLKAVSIGQYAFFGGGRKPLGSVSNRLEILDTTTMTWLSEQAIPDDIAAAAVGRYALYGGGQNTYGASDLVYVFELSLPEEVPGTLVTPVVSALSMVNLPTFLVIFGCLACL